MLVIFLTLGREVYLVNGTCRTFFDTLRTEPTFDGIDVAEVVLDRDGIEGTSFLTFAATDAGSLARNPCDGAFILVAAGHIDPSSLRTAFPELDDLPWTSLRTFAAGSTFLFIDYGQSRCLIDGKGSKLADFHTVATSQTAVLAGRLAGAGL